MDIDSGALDFRSPVHSVGLIDPSRTVGRVLWALRASLHSPALPVHADLTAALSARSAFAACLALCNSIAATRRA